MATVRETALEALATLLSGIFGAKFVRDPEGEIGESVDGVVVMRDGKPEVVEMTMSPVAYEIEHSVPIEIEAIGDARTATVDGLIEALDTALATANYNLNGAVLDARIIEGAEIVEADGTEGARSIRNALVNVRLVYVSSSPTG